MFVSNVIMYVFIVVFYSAEFKLHVEYLKPHRSPVLESGSLPPETCKNVPKCTFWPKENLFGP